MARGGGWTDGWRDLRRVAHAERLHVGYRAVSNERGPVIGHEQGEDVRLGVALQRHLEGEDVLEELFERRAHFGEHRAEGLRGALSVGWTEP